MTKYFKAPPVLENTHLAFLACVAITLPFDIKLPFTNAKMNNIFIVLLAIVTFFRLVFYKRKMTTSLLCGVALFIALYLLYVLGLIYTENLNQGLSEVEKKVSLLLFPIVLWSWRRTKEDVEKILACFCVSCYLTVMACILIATYRYSISGETKYFFYHDLSEIAGMHAVYLSMYCCFSVAILIYFLSTSRHPISRKRQIVLVVLMLSFATFIFLLAGRTHIFLLVIGSIAYLAYLFTREHNIFIGLLKAAGIGLIILVIALLFPTNRERFKQAINYKGQYSLSGQWGEQQMRPLIWTCAIQSIKDVPLFGSGTGDVQDVLQHCYVSRDFVSLLIWEPIRFNAHNQFLEIQLGLGIAGLAVFLGGLMMSVSVAFKNRNALYLAFLAIFVVSCMTESLLQRHHGVVFYSFFNALFFFSCSKSGATADAQMAETN